MALLPAYAIDGGRVPAQMLRTMAWVATNGAGGIVTPTDFRVSALSVPGNAVNVLPGGSIIPTNYSGASSQQSYVVANNDTFQVSVPATAGSSRTSYIILRINDPQYGGQTPPNPLDATYVEAVHVTSLNQSRPYLALARINMPANTSTVSNAMITDLRKVANPRKERHVAFTELPAGSVNYVPHGGGSGGNYGNFASGWVPSEVPSWANRVIVRADVMGVINQNADVDGRMRVVFGSNETVIGETRFDFNWNGQTERHDITVAGEGDISDRAGTTNSFQIRGRRMGGSGRLMADSQSAVIFDYEWIEAPA